MDIANDEIRGNDDVPEIRLKRIPCSREHGKLCSGRPETNLPSLPVGAVCSKVVRPQGYIVNVTVASYRARVFNARH